jgi:C4-dicarboxylate transporter, DctQ subunit
MEEKTTSSGAIAADPEAGKQQGIGLVLFDRVLAVCFWVSVAILLFMMVAVCWDVIARKAWSKPLTWVLEYTEYGLLFIGMLAAPLVLKENGHVRIDLVLTRLGKKNEALLNAVTSIVCAATSAIVAWYGFMVSWEKLQSGSFQPTAHMTPDFPVFIVIPVGFLLMAICFVGQAVSQFRKSALEKLRAAQQTCEGE